MKPMAPVLGSLLVAVSAAQAAGAEPRRPNLVILYADDLGWGDVSFNGRTSWPTPNLDRLAAQGTLFRRWYSAATVCAPSRAALLTGRYGIHSGVTTNAQDLPGEETTLAEALRPLGYATALFGKWHPGKPRQGGRSLNPLDHGFDEFIGIFGAREAWEHFPKELMFGRERRPVTGYSDTLFTDYGIEFVRKHRDRPFLLYMAYNSPHFHVEAPPEDLAPFKGKFPEKNTEEPVNAAYAAMMTRLDAEIGRLVGAIDDTGLGERTLIVFSSDNGATFEVGTKGAPAFHDSNAPFRGQKRTLHEGGIRVPGWARWTGTVPAGKVSEGLVHMTDVMPTCLAAAGGTPDPSWKLDGHNLLPAWTGKGKWPQRTLFWEWRSESANLLAAMRGDLKLVVADGRSELYDVQTDPAERRNRIAEFPGESKSLRKELDAWLATERK